MASTMIGGSYYCPKLDLEDGQGGKEEAHGQVMGASCSRKSIASRENLVHSGNFREFGMVEMQKVGKRCQEMESER